MDTNTTEVKQTKQPNQQPDKQPDKQPATSDLKSKIFKYRIPLILLFAVIILIIVFVYFTNKIAHDNSGFLRFNGRIEGYETNVGAKIAGRVESIANREGEEVKLGQMLVRLSDEDIQAQLRGAKARYLEAIQSVHEAEAQLQVAREQVNQAKLGVTQSREDARGRIDQAAANVATQRATYKQAIAQEIQAKADLELARIRIKRYDDLVLKGAVTQDEDDQAHSTYDGAVATVEARHEAVLAALKQISSAEGALVQAKSNAINPPIRISQTSADVKTVAQNEAALARAKHDVQNAKAAIDEIEANIVYLNIRSPIHGLVTARTVEPGAVVAAGQTVISLIDLDTVFLRAYVPDGEIGKIRLGQRVNVFYDSTPKTAVKGKVIEIDPQASFTPENIYFRDDRVKQVFGIKIQIDNPDNYAKPGMPADADIDIRPDSGAEEARQQAPPQNPPQNPPGAPLSNKPNNRDEQNHEFADPNARDNLEPEDSRLLKNGDYLQSPYSVNPNQAAHSRRNEGAGGVNNN